ncbi:mechanosensitive ion channel family protein [Sphingomonas sp. Leaf208]|uniref:mechanosensitive ion channel family protein n=1 Tax=Sphingomonas sp. Leaf208 TaxID=1735679 RepID=UPI000A5FE052|nr:mechanosensitive ion channel domain-containing protein [Sphingomonas sp. Leaf208]
MFRSLHIPSEWVWLESVAVVSAAVLVALIAHWLTMRIGGHAQRRSTAKTDGLVLARVRRPLRAVFVSVAVAFVSRILPMDNDIEDLWKQLLGFLVPGLLGWLAVAALRAFQDVIEIRADISVEDNLRARRKRTRAAILGRIGTFFIIFVSVCLMLLSVPGIRSIGVTLMASAGIAGLVVGAAAQPALKNLIAGVQMAFTEPIRIDDVLIVDGEWGRVEQINLTFVVIKIWDERRLVVPVSKFLEQSFQNWTRETSQLMGSVFWYLDPSADVPRLREKLGEIVTSNPRWDKRFYNLQVTDVKTDCIELRGLMTAKDAAIAFDLRCDVREALLKYIREEMPSRRSARHGRARNAVRWLLEGVGRLPHSPGRIDTNWPTHPQPLPSREGGKKVRPRRAPAPPRAP